MFDGPSEASSARSARVSDKTNFQTLTSLTKNKLKFYSKKSLMAN
jgi:hypothetical protein